MVKLYHPDNGYFFSGDDIEIQATIDRGGEVVDGKPKIMVGVAEAVEVEIEVPNETQIANTAFVAKAVKKYGKRK